MNNFIKFDERKSIVKNFLDVVFYEPLEKDESIECRYFDSNKRTGARNKWFKSTEDFAEFLNYDDTVYNYYFGVATRRYGGGKKEDTMRLFALYVDVDDKDKEAIKKICTEFPVAPSIVVLSGNGAHLYWLLEKPYKIKDTKDILKMEKVLKGLCKAIGGDCAAAEIARILRVPETLNIKYNPPRSVKIAQLNSNLRYAFGDLQDTFTDIVEYAAEQNSAPLPINESPIELSDEEKRKLSALTPASHNRNITFFNSARRYAGKGYAAEGIFAALKSYAAQCQFSDDELLSAIKQGLKYLIPTAGMAHNYRWSEAEGILYKKSKNGDIQIANFLAKIEEEKIITYDDVSKEKSFVISGSNKLGNFTRIEIPVDEFEKMDWLMRLSKDAIIFDTSGARNSVRCAILHKSYGKDKKTVQYSHTGWREIEGVMRYLSGSNVLGGEFPVINRLTDGLLKYGLPATADNESESIKQSLKILNLAPPKIALPLLAVTYLSPLTTLLDQMPPFVIYIFGPTKSFKSTVSVICLSHFGGFYGIEQLHNFSDTMNFLERRAWILKDTLMIIDDLHPSSSSKIATSMEGVAQGIIRAFSNRTGRGRLNANSTEKGQYIPRGMAILTGEMLPQIESTVARIFPIEFHPNDINKNVLTDLQNNSSMLPQAMTSYILYVQQHVKKINEEFNDFKKEYFDNKLDIINARLPMQDMYLLFSTKVYTQWLVDKGIKNKEQREKILEDFTAVLKNSRMERDGIVSDEKPEIQAQNILKELYATQQIKLYDKVHGKSTVVGKD